LIRLAPSSNDTTFIFSLGRAFWILKAGSLKVDTTVAAAALDSINAADVPLHTGWNLITDPFSDSVSWSAVESMNAISQPLYEFRGAFQVASSLVAGNGYYFFNQGNMSVLRVPFQSEARAKLIAANRVDEFDSSAWSVKVILDAGGIIDNSTWFGVSRFATDGFNPLDVRKPAGMRFVPGSYFSRPDWDKSYSIFGSDVRAEFSDLSEWNIDVNSRPSQSARLQFSGLENVPSVFDVYALDPISQTWINLRRSPSFNFVPLSETTSFDIVVGNAESVRKKIVDSDAKTFSLGQNYPNPFNPSTVIPVYDRISSHLKITVFDILGQEVATIFDGDVQPGQHLFNWDATDRDGRAVASGVYIYRAAFEPGESMVRKMVLLR